MKPVIDEEKIEEALTRGVSKIFPSKEALKTRLLKGEKLSFYFGVDPTSEHLHVGHAVGLLTLRLFQELGHKIIFLIGDFTAQIGDPTDKMAARGLLTKREVEKNMKTFKEQAGRIISFSGGNAAEIECNSKWYEKMNMRVFMRDLSGFFTVRNMLQRDMFKARRKNRDEESWLDDISLNELIYPLLQGHDGVELDVDVEVGGNDQIFNMGIGHALRKAVIGNDDNRIYSDRKYTKKGEKFSIAMNLLVNSATGKKLSKTEEGSLINIDDEPNDMFGKVMALPDGMISSVAELSTQMPMREVKKLESMKNQRDAKLTLAFEVVKLYHNESDARKARENWEKTFSKRETPDDAPVLKIPAGKISAADIVAHSGVAKSKSEAGRLIAQGGFEVNETKITDPRAALTFKTGDILKIGKRHFFRIGK